MKRIGALVCLMIMAVSVLAPACFAEDETAASGKSNFSIESSTPEDGATGVAVENLSVKIYFDTAMLPESKSIRQANAKAFKMTNKKGKEIPIKVYYSHKEEGLMMVLSDTLDTDIQIQGDTEYTLTIDGSLRATDGTQLGKKQTITFKTLDQSQSTMVYMIMMGVMIAGMIFFTSRSAKKQAEKDNKDKYVPINPYKEAKRTGKSVEEIVEKEKQRRAKYEAALAKKQAQDAELAAEEAEKARKASNKRVPAPKPIAAVGSDYKVKVKKTQKPQNKGTTNPKGQTGKQKNSKGKGKKKK
ncbi:MAG: Ig-like domain-containing protein [Bacillota bacterium]|nr:Ig-like domain-containing protein [Bacillota bacterium]